MRNASSLDGVERKVYALPRGVGIEWEMGGNDSWTQRNIMYRKVSAHPGRAACLGSELEYQGCSEPQCLKDHMKLELLLNSRVLV